MKKYVGIEWDKVLSVPTYALMACLDCQAMYRVLAKCKEMKPKFVYVHCYKHCLNLVLVDSIVKDNHVTFNIFGTIKLVIRL